MEGYFTNIYISIFISISWYQCLFLKVYIFWIPMFKSFRNVLTYYKEEWNFEFTIVTPAFIEINSHVRKMHNKIIYQMQQFKKCEGKECLSWICSSFINKIAMSLSFMNTQDMQSSFKVFGKNFVYKSSRCKSFLQNIHT